MSPQPGEIWLADLGLAGKTRPVVIASRQDPDPPRALALYVPLTTQRRNSPYEVPLPRLPFLDRESVANVQGLGSLPAIRLERKIGRLSGGVIERLKDALAFALDLKRASDKRLATPTSQLPCHFDVKSLCRRSDRARTQSRQKKDQLLARKT